MSRDALAGFHPPVRDWFRGVLRGADAGPEEGLAADPRRAVHAAAGADGVGQDAGGLPGGDRPADVLARAGEEAGAAACCTSRRSRRSRSTSSGTCARRSPGSRRSPSARASRIRVPDASRSDRETRPPTSAPASRAHPPDILITTPESLYLMLTSQAARDPRLGRDRHRRRDPRPRRLQARRAPVPVAGAARGAAPERPPAAAHRALGDAAAARRDRAPARRRRGPRQEGPVEAARPSRSWMPAARKAFELTVEVPVEDMAASARRRSRPGPPSAPPRSRFHLAVDLPAAGRARPVAPLDDDLRQQPAAGRAPGGGPERDAPARRSRSRTTARSRAKSGSEIEDRLKRGTLPAIVADVVARARHRHGRRGSGRSRSRRRPRSRRACSGSAAPATGRRGLARRHLSQVPRRPAGVRRPRRPRMREGKVEETCVSAQSRWTSWRSRSSPSCAGRRGRASTSCTRWSAARRRSPSCRARPSKACSTCSPGAIPPTNSRSCGRASPGTASAAGSARARGRGRVAIVNAGTIPDRGLYGVFLGAASDPRRSRARRRARRGDGVRVAAGRRLRPRRLVLAHRGDHPRSRPGLAGARAARQDAVLARRPARPAARVRARPSASSPATLAADKPKEAAKRLQDDARPRPARRRQPGRLPGGSGGRDRRGAERPDRRRRAIPATRSATGASACSRPFGRPRPRAVGDRGPGAAEGIDGRGRRGDLVGRRHGLSPARVRRAARRPVFLPAADEIEDLVVRQPRPDLALRGAFPRERGAGAPAAPAPPGPAQSALGAAQARGRSAGGRLAVRVLPDPAGDLPRVPARRLRPAGHGRDPAPHRVAAASAS